MDKLLIVDDQPDIRKLLRITLSRSYDLLEAEDAMSAWEIILRDQPRGVILDVMMPGEMDGYQLCEKIRKDPKHKDIYVVLVTARGQISDRERGMAVGANDYFVKPYSPLELIKTIKASLG